MTTEPARVQRLGVDGIIRYAVAMGGTTPAKGADIVALMRGAVGFLVAVVPLAVARCADTTGSNGRRPVLSSAATSRS